MPGDGGDWWYPNRLKLDVAGSPKRGETVLNVGDTKPLDASPYDGGVGQIVQISLKNDVKLPVTGVTHFEYLARQFSRIVAKTATTVTISPPLHFDLPANHAPMLRPAGRCNHSIGIEDLAVDGSNTTFSRGLILLGTTAGSWLKNVAMRNAERYIFVMDGTVQCQVEQCFIGGRKSVAGPNGGGLLVQGCSSCLVQDNIVADTFPDMEIDYSTGNVFAYNFTDDKAVQGDLLGPSIDANHGAHCCFNLYEGNYCPRFSATAIMAARPTTLPSATGSTGHPPSPINSGSASISTASRGATHRRQYPRLQGLPVGASKPACRLLLRQALHLLPRLPRHGQRLV